MNGDSIKKACFLYVEDDAPSRRVMELIMKKFIGVEDFMMFEDSANFMAKMKVLPKRPDVILMDIHMRPQDGFKLLIQLQAEADYRNTKVVAVTASVMNEEVEQLRTAGFNGAVGKPLNFDAFPNLLERILAGETVWYVS